MATMGVRVRQPAGGLNLNLGEDFAKAMFGDWEAELKMAKARSDLALDEWQAKQIKSAIEYNNARTATENWELGSRKGGVEAGANIIQGGNQPQPEAPAPVDLGLPETTLAIPMPRPDLSPAPVEEEPEEYGPPIPPELSAAPVELPDEATAAPAPRPIIASGGDYELGGPDDPAAIEDVPELLPDEEDISVQPVPVAEAVTAEEVPQAEVPTGGERQPMPVSATGDVIQVDEGPTGDTAAVTTPAGNVRIMSREDALKLSAAVIANGGNVAGGLRELAGIAGIQSSPTLSPDVKAATLLSGNVPSRESILGTDEAIREKNATANPKDKIILIDGEAFAVAGYGEDGLPILKKVEGSPTKPDPRFGDTEGGLRNKIIADVNLKLDAKQPLTPQEVMDYAQAYQDEYGIKIVETIVNGKTVASKQQIDPPRGTRTIDEVIAGKPPANAQAQPQVVQPPAVAETPETQAPAPPDQAQPQVVPAEPQVAPKPKYKSYGGYVPEGQAPPSKTEVTDLGGAKITTTTKGIEQPSGEPTQNATDTYRYQSQALEAAAILNEYLPGKEPGAFAMLLDSMSEEDSIDARFIEQHFTDENTRRFARATLSFANSQAREESGAAIGVKELRRYIKRFSQPPGQKASDYWDTRRARNAAMRADRMSLNGAMKGAALMDLDKRYAAAGIDLDEQSPGGRGPIEEGQPETALPQTAAPPTPNTELPPPATGGGGDWAKGEDGVWRKTGR